MSVIVRDNSDENSIITITEEYVNISTQLKKKIGRFSYLVTHIFIYIYIYLKINMCLKIDAHCLILCNRMKFS